MDGPGSARPAACEKVGLKDESGTAAKDTTSIGSGDRVSGADRMGVEVHEKAADKLKSVKVQREVDFVANQGSRRYYIQVAFEMPDKEKEEQEKTSLRGINDSFKKIIIVGNPIKVKRDEDGFTTMSIWDFLLKKNSLEL